MRSADGAQPRQPGQKIKCYDWITGRHSLEEQPKTQLFQTDGDRVAELFQTLHKLFTDGGRIPIWNRRGVFIRRFTQIYADFLERETGADFSLDAQAIIAGDAAL